MRSYLLKTMASVVAITAALAMVAGTAIAQVNLSVQTDTVWGLWTREPETTVTPAGTSDTSGEESQITGEAEANLNWSASSGPFNYKGRLRIETHEPKDNGFIDTTRHLFQWNVSDTFQFEIHPRSFGIPSMGVGDISGVIGDFTFGDALAYIVFLNQRMVNVNFMAGANTFGVAIADSCVVGCGLALVDDAGNIDVEVANKNEQSYILHANGSAGAIAWGVNLVQSTGDVANTKTTGTSTVDDDFNLSSTGFDVGVKFSGPAQIGLTLQSVDRDCAARDDATALVAGISCTNEFTAAKLGLAAAGAKIAFTTTESEVVVSAPGSPDQTFTDESTNIDASYSIPLAEGVVWGPELRIESTEEVDDDATTIETTTVDQMLIGIAMSASF